MPFKSRCPTCGSRHWHKEPSSGMIVCSEGHILESYRNESNEMEFAGQHVMRQRQVKKKKQKKGRNRANPQIYHGSMGRLLYFQCLQILLRMQVSALVKLWDLPSEFEVVCRDVWALNLCLLSQPIHGNTDEVEDTPTQASDTKAQNTDGEESDGNENDIDSELEQLLSGNSDSSSEDENEGTRLDADKQQSGKTRRKVRGEEGPPSTIVVLMIACWLLRIPVICQDFSRAIEAYELPYLDCTRLLPVDLTSHLTKHVKQSLSPHHAPKTLILHALCSRLARKLNQSYGIVIPEVNAAPILWRAVCGMGGTPTLYMLAKRLSQVFPLKLVLHSSSAPDTPDVKKEVRGSENAPVEVTFVAVIVIVLKMVYGLDGKERTPKTPDDLACSLPRLHDFLANLRSLDKDEYKYDSRRFISVGDLKEEEIDEYLDFCEGALLGTNQENQAPENGMVNGRFPLQGRTNERSSDRNNQELTQGRRILPMTATSVRPGGKGMPPGKDYWIWSGRDVLGILPSELWETMKRGGQWGGVDEEYICSLVEKYEERLFRWWHRAESEAMATGM
ncbi:hypothetical protein JOM56_008515 [Amanita muscaria]